MADATRVFEEVLALTAHERTRIAQAGFALSVLLAACGRSPSAVFPLVPLTPQGNRGRCAKLAASTPSRADH